MSPRYPFTALVGQESMKLALVLNAINPRLGGVLIRGQKGTAKTTAARGLAALLPPIDVADECRFGCEPRPEAPRCPECQSRGLPTASHARPAAFVELPIGTTEDRVLGTLDIERALTDGQRHFEPGLLARANRGLLYIDEVNLLPDHLVDTLLDAAAMGTNTVEREGISFSHPSAFVLVGTMNPEEGELRPQLLDRFALAVDVEGFADVSQRTEVVRRRIAFEADPEAFSHQWAPAEGAEQARIQRARSVLPRVRVDDHLLELIARICASFEVDGMRADIVIYKTAVTLAAYGGRERVTTDDIRRAAELALPHRRRRQPFDEHGLDREKLDDLVRQHSAPSDPEEPPQSDSDRDNRDDDPPPRTPLDSGSGQGERVEQIFEVASVSVSAPIAEPRSSPRGPLANDRSARRTRMKLDSPRGRHVRSSAVGTGAVDVLATLREAAPHQAQRRPVHSGRMVLQRADLRFKVREMPVRTLTVFAVDASGSMAARRRMALAKGAVHSLLLHAYQNRDEVALIAFRSSAADVVLPPTSSAQLAALCLRGLPTGGRTPLALALRRANALLTQRTATRGRAVRATLVLVSDGRANVALTDTSDAYDDALAEARLLRSTGVTAIVVDSEEGPLRLGRARMLADELGARYLRLADLSTPANPERAFGTSVDQHQRRV